MKNRFFRNSLFISLASHITVFSIFSLSFGNRIFKADYTSVAFFGSILGKQDLNLKPYATPNILRSTLNKEIFAALFIKEKKESVILAPQYVKPFVTLPFNKEKLVFAPAHDPIKFQLPLRKEPTVIFHPYLPYDFLFYFKDRQKVHIELMFNIVPRGKMNTVLVKRKISSGNLEADLLSIRYISHYLFIQQTKLISDNWQVVKIDLSAQND
ncbi:MAG: hypothetical protein A2166_03415 [Omnitrophica WOR_2 bacterium RBG_13_41_10]|nr:MAG: hypothetical protein A2166_03415 [Omnitrophica WOR_2 bacterium RBG_13_41_10]